MGDIPVFWLGFMVIPIIAAISLFCVTVYEVITAFFFRVRHGTAVIVKRFGKVQPPKYAGLHSRLPLFSSLETPVSLRPTLSSVVVSAPMKGKFNAAFTCILIHRVTDPVKYLYASSDPLGRFATRVKEAASTAIREHEWHSVLTKSRSIAKVIKQELKDSIVEYGCVVETVLVCHLSIDAASQESMEAILRAAYQKEAELVRTNGEAKVKLIRAEAAAEKTALEGKAVANENLIVGQSQTKAAKILAKVLEDKSAKDAVKAVLPHWLLAIENTLSTAKNPKGIIMAQSVGSDLIREEQERVDELFKAAGVKVPERRL